jgi:ER protein Pkr1.
MLQGIVDSIFSSGTNKTIRVFTCVVFVLLMCVLLGMIFLTNFNIHVIFMFILSVGVFASVVWFMYELEKAKSLDEQDKHNGTRESKKEK